MGNEQLILSLGLRAARPADARSGTLTAGTGLVAEETDFTVKSEPDKLTC